MLKLFSTTRLELFEVQRETFQFFEQIPEIFSDAVVKALPTYFHGVNNTAAASVWFDRVMNECRLYAITKKGESNRVIGFILAYDNRNHCVQIGYLLGEQYWGAGFAYEILSAFIDWAQQNTSWQQLIGGVEKSNTVSANLLTKLGFTQAVKGDAIGTYEYSLNIKKDYKET